MKSSFHILIADGLGDAGLDRLKSLSNVELNNATGISAADLAKALPAVDVLVVRSRTQVTADLLQHADKLKLVVRAGIGLDNIDIAAATEKGVVVMNAPTGNTVTTAEHAIAMMFSVSRRIPAADASLRAGKWEKKKFQGNQLSGKTLGIVGLGNIGRTVAVQARGLGMHILGYDPFVTEEKAAEQQIRLLPLEEIFKKSDYITLHVPLNQSTKHLVDEKAFSLMEKKPYIINCARGGVVDEKALENALEKGAISGCALDVFESEPPPEKLPLFARDNVVVTPHLGASTDEAQTLVGLEVADEIAQYVTDGIFKNAVNVPSLSVEQLESLRPLLSLCERLGAFIGQVAPEKVNELQVHFEGAVAENYNKVLTLSILKGFLSPNLSTSVNFVNAGQIAKDKGIRVQESFSEDCANFASLISVSVKGKETLSCSGTLFGKSAPRIVKINGLVIDAIPAGCLLYTRNHDHPGVIGWMGSTLGSEGVNISRMALGLDKEQKQAIALINVDSHVSESTLKKLRGSKDMISVKQISL